MDGNIEIDLILERAGQPTFLIEIKSTTYVNLNHISHLKLYKKNFANSVALLISRDKVRKKIDETLCLHWSEALVELDLVK